MSLRARLILGLLVLAGAGLVTLAAITYFEQRSFQLSRVDQEAQAGLPYVDRQLDCQGANMPDALQGPQEGCQFGEGGPQASLPVGTFGYRVGPTGRVLGYVHQTYVLPNGTLSNRRFPQPSLPSSFPAYRFFTAGSAAGINFRVYAQPTHDEPGATTIIAIPLTDVEQSLHRLLAIEAIVVGSVLLALAALSWWVVRLGLRPLDRIATTAGAIADGDLAQRVTPATERTEVGRLGLALNAMLAQIEKAFRARAASEDRLRRFLADASHELRTPLASIRGYAELFRLGATDDPERAMQRIESEAVRMGQLVENLLMLARLDQMPATAKSRVELTELITEAVEDARASAPERQIELKTHGPTAVSADPAQLKQVISNLLRNALVHTPAATAVDVEVTSDEHDALLTVRDHGRGLPTGHTDALFERFWRAEPGRGRGAAGAGLGLSIVKAIVEGHGGQVKAANATGGGASFTVRLPLISESRPPAAVPSGASAMET